MAGRAPGRSGFGPVVLAGLAAGALLAVAGSHAWVSYTTRPAQLSLVGSDIGQVPLAAALSYLLLASWGVLLVTRRVVRRVFAVVALLTALGLAATVVDALASLPGDVRDRFPGSGVTVSTSFTGWIWAAAVAVLVSLAATTLAVRRVPAWPEMGRRYDAPTGETPDREPARETHRGTHREPGSTDPDDPEAGNLELWKAIDQGHDPTT